MIYLIISILRYINFFSLLHVINVTCLPLGSDVKLFIRIDYESNTDSGGLSSIS